MSAETRRVLVTGGNGFLGEKTCAVFRDAGAKVSGTSRSGSGGMLKMEMTDGKSIAEAVKKAKPDVVIHTAANKDNDFCESNRKQVHAINTEGTAALAGACRERGARMVYVSTEYVFDGRKGSPYSEEDKTSPVNYYGTTKAEGERAVLAELEDALIVRPGILYGFNNADDKTNFVWWALNEMKNGRAVKGFTDQVFCPVLIDDVAEAMLALIRKEKAGIYHVTGGECLTRHEFLVKGAKVFGFSPALVKRSTWAESGRIANKPSKLVLDIGKLHAEGIETRGVKAGFEEMKKQVPKEWFSE